MPSSSLQEAAIVIEDMEYGYGWLSSPQLLERQFRDLNLLGSGLGSIKDLLR